MIGKANPRILVTDYWKTVGARYTLSQIAVLCVLPLLIAGALVWLNVRLTETRANLMEIISGLAVISNAGLVARVRQYGSEGGTDRARLMCGELTYMLLILVLSFVAMICHLGLLEMSSARATAAVTAFIAFSLYGHLILVTAQSLKRNARLFLDTGNKVNQLP